MTQQVLEDLFADLRADTVRTMRPPGTDAAYLTVWRRRRARRAAGAVGAGAVVVVVGLSWPGLGHRHFEEGDAVPRDLAGEARAAVVEATGDTVDYIRQPLGSSTVRDRTFVYDRDLDGRAVTAQAGLVADFRDISRQFAPGTYRLFLACSSTVAATVTVVVRPSRRGGPEMSGTAPCGDRDTRPVVSQPTFEVSGMTPEGVTITMRGATPADAPIGYAFVLSPDTSIGVAGQQPVRSATRRPG